MVSIVRDGQIVSGRLFLKRIECTNLLSQGTV